MRAFLRKIPILSDIFRHLRDQKKLMSKPIHTKSGFLFNGNNDQLNDNYEPEVATFLRENIMRFDSFINIGANIGYWPVLLRHLSFNGKIFAYEPDAHNLKLMLANIQANSLTGIETGQVALGNYNGHIDLYGFGTGISSIKGWAGGNSKRKQSVRISLLDDLISVSPGPKLLLIDVEGAEFDVLRGAKQILSGNCELLVEITASEHQPGKAVNNPKFLETFEYMKELGFKVSSWLPHLRELSATDLENIHSGQASPQIQMYYFSK